MRYIRHAILAAIAAVSASPAAAVIVTRQFDVMMYFGGGSVNPLLGSFTITYDNAADNAQTTNGITVNSLNLSGVTNVGFSTSGGYFTIGGITTLTGVTGVNSNERDFSVNFTSPESATPSLNGGAISYGDGTAYTSFGGTIAASDVVTNVPEPAAWALLISGFGLVGAASRRRRIAYA